MGELNISHSIANLNDHYFKYDLSRNPGDLHGHFLGTAIASFYKGIQPRDGDVFDMFADGFGKASRNTLKKQPYHR